MEPVVSNVIQRRNNARDFAQQHEPKVKSEKKEKLGQSIEFLRGMKGNYLPP